MTNWAAILMMISVWPVPTAISTTGPLRVSTLNPRYFTDGSGRGILLTGSHTWGNLQDYTYATQPSPPSMDFSAYLGFLRQHNHNFFRLWVWESSFNPNAKQGTIRYDPMPHQRPGPGLALDGKPKFDLTLFNQAYFDRLRNRVMAAKDNGIYVSIMLFNGFSIEGKGNVGGDPWQGHPFNPKNNVNGVNAGSGRSIHTLSNPVVTAHQEAYVRHVIDTVNDLDNVLYEISNEDSGGPDDTAWQVHMIRFIKSYEAGKAEQHPVGMTQQWPEGNEADLFTSPADWISPGAKMPAGDGRKVILNDTDHSYFWTGLKADGLAAQRHWVWENFTRGNQCLFMDPYLDPSHDPGRNNPAGDRPDPYWDTLRDAMGWTRAYAERMNLAAMKPRPELSSTGYCLANAGVEYLIYQPKPDKDFSVELKAGTYSYEWFDPTKGVATDTGRLEAAGGKQPFQAPFDRDAVLYLERVDQSSDPAANAPYPPSTFIKGVSLSDLVLDGVTSGDQWPATWADDGHLYSAWGDGTGFGYRGGWDDHWTTYLGIARVQGDPPNHKGCNVWGGYQPESDAPADYRNRELDENLKPNSSLVCIGGVLYLYAVRARAGLHGPWSVSRLHSSKDHGRTWTDHGVLFDEPKGRFGNVCVIQYGKDYAGTPPFQENYVYLYGMEDKEPTSNRDVLLARCDRSRLQDRGAYQFFSGTANNPSWSTDLNEARSIFHADDGVSWWVWCVYDAALERYLLLTTHPPFGGQFKDHKGFGMFEAQQPWGPWKTILYTKDVGSVIQGMTEVISFTIPSRWIQDEGRTLWMVFAGRPSNPYYSFNLVKLKLDIVSSR